MTTPEGQCQPLNAGACIYGHDEFYEGGPTFNLPEQPTATDLELDLETLTARVYDACITVTYASEVYVRPYSYQQKPRFTIASVD